MLAPDLPALPAIQSSTLQVDTAEKLSKALVSPVPGQTIELTASFAGRIVIPDGTKGLRVVSKGTTLYQPTADPVVVVGLGCEDIALQGFGVTRRAVAGKQMGLVVCGYDAALTREAAKVEELPNRVLLEDLAITGDPNFEQRYGILGNARNLTISGCVITDIHEVGVDSQGILVTNTPGPVSIRENHIVAAGENIMFGGSNPTIKGLQLGHATIVGNYLSKLIDWQKANWSVKNLLELKACDRALIASNVMSNCWLASQDGTAVLFTPRNNQLIGNIQFHDNVIYNVGSGVLVSAEDNFGGTPSPTGEIEFSGNRWINVGGLPGSGRVYDFVTPSSNQIRSIWLEGERWYHSVGTGSSAMSIMYFEGIAPSVASLTMKSCFGSHAKYGIIGSGNGSGLDSIKNWVKSYSFEDVDIFAAPGSAGLYPAGVIFYV